MKHPETISAALLDARWARSPHFAPDGQALCFVSNLTGPPQRWMLERGQGGWPRPIAAYEEAGASVAFSPCPGDPRFLVSRDPSGTGRTQLHLCTASDPTGTLLTGGHPAATHTYCGWAKHGEAIFFAANRRRADRYDLFWQALDGTPARCVWQNDAPGFLSSLVQAPDGRRVLVRRTPSNVEHALIEIDLATGRSRPLRADAPTTCYFAPTYAPDGHGLYVLTDHDADFCYLARLDLATEALTPLLAPDADVEQFAFTEPGDRLAYTVNREGYSRLWLREGDSDRPAPLPPDAGVLADLTFAPDGTRLAFTLTRPDRPADVFVWHLHDDTCRPVTHAAASLAVPTVAPESITYESFDGRRIPAFFFRPEASGDAPMPVVVYLHGGPEAQLRPAFNPFLQFFVSQGFGVLAPNVRGSTGYGRAYSHLDDGRRRRDAIADVAHAARWLRARPDVDADRLVACGESYGGFLTLATLTHDPELWAAGISVSGMSSLVTFLEGIAPAYRAYREVEYGRLDADRDFLLDVSPLTQAQRIEAPVMLVHGARDPRVPLREPEQLAALLRARQIPVRTLFFEDEGHALLDPTHQIHAWTTMIDFLRTHLADEVPTPPAGPALSRDALAAMAARAASLDERLEGRVALSAAPDDDPTTATRWAAWRKAAAHDDPVRFARRLAWDGLDEAAARRRLGPATWPGDAPLPSWTTTLADALQTPVNPSSDFRNPQSERFLPFEELVAPFVAVARERLARLAGAAHHVLAEAAHLHLEQQLRRTLVEVAHPVLSMKWKLKTRRLHATSLGGSQTSTPTPANAPALYERFLDEMQAGGWTATLRAYPVLARLLATATDLWVDTQAEFLGRLAADWPSLQDRFHPPAPLGMVTDVQAQLSDRHNGGRGVIVCTFAAGLRLVYKPRKMGLERLYNELLRWINAQEELLPLRALDVLDCGTHGWVAFAEAAPCRDEAAAERFYRRMGLLLGLLYGLHGSDCHYENVIACGEQPVLIDAEMLAVPRLRELSPKHPRMQHQEAFVAETLFQTLFLPVRLPSADKHWHDMSALLAGHPAFGQPGQAAGRQPDQPFRVSRATRPTHLPHLHGLPLDPHAYVEEIAAGFEQMYAFLARHRTALWDGPLAGLAAQQVRVIFRHTSTYAKLMRAALQPKLMRDGMAYSLHYEQLAWGYRTREGTRSKHWPLLAAERQALARLDVPYLTTRTDAAALPLPTGETIAACFTPPSLERVRQRLDALNDADCARQTGLLRAALAAHRHAFDAPSSESAAPEVPDAPVAAAPATPEAFRAEARRIARTLIAEALPLTEGGRVWLASERLRPSRQYHFGPMGYGLADGQAGLALFFGAMAHATDDAACRSAAYDALAPILEALDDPSLDDGSKLGLGLDAGIGGLVYALTHLAGWLGDPSLLEAARQAATRVTPERIAEDAALDVLAGSAGTLLGLLPLYEATGDTAVLARAYACGAHLLEQRREAPTGHRVWETVTPGRLLTGMSHGAAGIAYALVRLGAHTQEAAFRDAAQEALAYERAVFDPEAGNWPDFRADEQPAFWTTWCHGAPGIGLARLGCLPLRDDDPMLHEEIETALDTTRRYDRPSWDHLCCGTFGRMDLLVEASQQLARPDLLAEARQRAALGVAEAHQRGGYLLTSPTADIFAPPSLFFGMAGIGYQLLRLADPTALPSVLAMRGRVASEQRQAVY